ncbi:MAG: hypothetical protein AAF216_13965 [Pseudomonadota bacterium]
MSRIQVEAGMRIVLWLLVLGSRSPLWDLAGGFQLLHQTIAVCAETLDKANGLLSQSGAGLFDRLPLCKLGINQALTLLAVSEEGRMGVGLIAPDDLAAIAGDPLPETGDAVIGLICAQPDTQRKLRLRAMNRDDHNGIVCKLGCFDGDDGCVCDGHGR